MKVDVYTSAGKKAKNKADVSDSVFAVAWNGDLVHQVVVGMAANKRTSLAHTKDRGEVSGGGKKPWKQKGTGRARHGSSRSPIWRGGGVTFGPKNTKDYSQKINKKVRLLALANLLSAKSRDEQLLFVQGTATESMKTKAAQATLSALATISGFETINTLKNPNNILLLVPEITEEITRSFGNFPHVKVIATTRVNAYDLAQSRYVIIIDPVLASTILEARVAGTYNKVADQEVEPVLEAVAEKE
ncbi:MAG: large subunit ribosomal protein L4 [Planctomycetota bacterium]|jgi:large subunit ribosomal protein L4